MKASWLTKQHVERARQTLPDQPVPLSTSTLTAHNDLLAALHGIGYETRPMKNGDQILKSEDNVTTTLLGASAGNNRRQALGIQIIEHAKGPPEVMLDYGTAHMDKGELSTLDRTSVRKFDSFQAAKDAIIAWGTENSSRHEASAGFASPAKDGTATAQQFKPR